MGIKTTIRLTRAEALELYDELRHKLHGQVQLTDEELGDALDDLREEECRRHRETCFENYLVVSEHEKSADVEVRHG